MAKYSYKFKVIQGYPNGQVVIIILWKNILFPLSQL